MIHSSWKCDGLCHRKPLSVFQLSVFVNHILTPVWNDLRLWPPPIIVCVGPVVAAPQAHCDRAPGSWRNWGGDGKPVPACHSFVSVYLSVSFRLVGSYLSHSAAFISAIQFYYSCLLFISAAIYLWYLVLLFIPALDSVGSVLTADLRGCIWPLANAGYDMSMWRLHAF